LVRDPDTDAVLSPRERSARGRAARKSAPRSAHGEWEPAPDRPNPIALLESQDRTRVAELVPIRYGRMMASPFAFYRGAAAVMASDLAATPDAGIGVQLCGDAHLSNFGGFASPERDMVFDLNDFDETHPGSWEWDLKRLAASIEIAARGRGFQASQRAAAVTATVGQYRSAMARFARMSNLDIWYARLDATSLVAAFRAEAGKGQLRDLQKAGAKGRLKDNSRAFSRLAHSVDGEPRIVSDPPLIVRLEDLLAPREALSFGAAIRGVMAEYTATLPADRRRLLMRYRFMDIARKVVGVGSVGTQAWVILFLGRDDTDPLFLQCKEAQASVLEAYVGACELENHGQRVVEGQRLMQAASDTMLGWLRTTGIDGESRDFYVRQLWDWKTSADVETMAPAGMSSYGRMCGWTLARAHARSGDCIAISSYLGRGDVFDQAIVRFAQAYAEQSERDHRALLDAVASGQIVAETGV
jgi:uncharacterized protein (DUF2252 family)